MPSRPVAAMAEMAANVALLLCASLCALYLPGPNVGAQFLRLEYAQWLQLGLILSLAFWRAEPSSYVIVASYLISRALLCWAPPVLETDFYRFLWDGHLTGTFHNPYSFAPKCNE